MGKPPSPEVDDVTMGMAATPPPLLPLLGVVVVVVVFVVIVVVVVVVAAAVVVARVGVAFLVVALGRCVECDPITSPWYTSMNR